MSLADGTCGTGGWTGPLPGDPDNNSILTAVAVYGGIEVSWTYPTLNPEAVSYVQIYRGTTNVLNNAVLYRIVSGNSYFDAIPDDNPNTWYYWIRIVSVHGTEGDPIGPAIATTVPIATQMLALLEGQLTESAFIGSLRTKIGEIDTLTGALATEVNDRLFGDSSLAATISSLQTETATLTTAVLNETTSRITEDSAQVTAINALGAMVNDPLTGLPSRASVSYVDQAEADAVSASATAIALVQSEVDGNSAIIATQATSIDGLSAQYTVKVDVNGYVSGYGLATTAVNGIPTSEFAVVADKFSIAPVATDPGAADGSPFFHLTTSTVINGVTVPSGTYMKSAFIHDASITNAKIGNVIQSADYVTGSAGWKIDKTGQMEMNNATFRGAVNVGAFTGYAWPAAGSYGAHLSSSGLLLGNANNGKYFQVSAEGNIYTPGFSVVNGVMTVSALNVINTANIADNAVTIPASAFAAGSSVSLNFDSYGAPITVVASGNARSSLYDAYIDILQDNVILKSLRFLHGPYTHTVSGTGVYGAGTLSAIIYPTTGVKTYKAQLRFVFNSGGPSGGGTTADGVNLLLLGVRR